MRDGSDYYNEHDYEVEITHKLSYGIWAWIIAHEAIIAFLLLWANHII